MEAKETILTWHKGLLTELAPADRELCQAAKQACLASYAPYSHFHVGAAVRLANGQIVCGSNQENAAYPSGLCAERCALFAANAQHPAEAVEALAIAACDEHGNFTPRAITPCGACRQVMLEVEQRYGKAIRVLLCGEAEVIVVDNCSSFLPWQFDATAL